MPELDPSQPEPSSSAPRRSLRRRIVRFARLLVAVVAVLVVIKGDDILFGQNFHAVEPGAVYRSAQLSGHSLESRVRELGIKSVLNLRGPGPGKDWYDDEVRSSDRAGARHYDVALSARNLPPPDQLKHLITILHEAPRPVLIHCKNGADRSGLASAIALVLDEKVAPADAASRQLSLWYGHIPIGATTAMDRLFELFEAGGSAKGFVAWVREDYPAVYEKERGEHKP